MQLDVEKTVLRTSTRAVCPNHRKQLGNACEYIQVDLRWYETSFDLKPEYACGPEQRKLLSRGKRGKHKM